MRKLLIGLLAVVFVLGMSSGVMADEYLSDLTEDVTSEFGVDIDIAPYVVMGELEDLDLDNLNNNENYSGPNSINVGNIPGQVLRTETEIKANYNFEIKVSSTGLALNGDRGNDTTSHINNLINYKAYVNENSNSVNTGGSGSTTTFTPEERNADFAFEVIFEEEDQNGNDVSWEDFTAGNYTDTITVTVSSAM